ncbi:MAG: type ISP restriction/modification enzyme, partial [Microcoleaceae cyanobacterium]
PDLTNGIEKLKFISQNKFNKLDFQRIQPDENNNWLHQSINDFAEFIQLFDKDKNNQEVLFYSYSNGISTNRDEWVYDLSQANLEKKVKYFISQYNQELKRWQKWKKDNKYIDNEPESSPTVDQFLHEKNLIKWSARLKRDKLRKGKKGNFNSEHIQVSLYRPYSKQNLYFDYLTIDLRGNLEVFREEAMLPNKIIALAGRSASQPFQCLASNTLVDLHLLSDTQCLSLYLYDEAGDRLENITDWGLTQFQEYYGDRKIKKIDIFHYVYAVLHDPNYRQKYEQNLKRDFPRIPYYEDFKQWAKWGKKLMDLHINYETAKPYKLKRVDLEKTGTIKPKLKADPEKGII